MTRDNRHLGSPGIRALPAGVLALLMILLIGASPAAAQTTALQITSVSTERWPVLEVTATVLDGDGQPVTGLSPDAFAGSVDGVSLGLQEIQTTSDPGVGIAVVLTFDVSGSMEGTPLENARAAGRALVSQLGASDQAAVVAFSDEPVVVQPFTADKGTLDEAIDGLVVGGYTSLYAAVQESVRVANEAPLPRRAIVLLSDGQDIGGIPVDPEAALASVEAGSAVFMSIGLGDGIDQDYLGRLAAGGRGQFRAAPTPEGLTALYQETAQVLRQQYILTFDAGGIEALRAHGKAVQIRATVGDTVLTAEATLTLPPALLVTPAPTVAPPTEPAPRLQPAAESDRAVLPVVLLGLAGAGATMVGTSLLWLRRRRKSDAEATAGLERLESARFELETRPPAYPTIERAATAESGAWLEAADRRVPLGDAPMTIGFTSDCMVMLVNGQGGRTERVRIWLRDGSYMLHNLSRMGSVTIAGRSITWAVLEDGDEIRMGGQTLVFRSGRPAAEI